MQPRRAAPLGRGRKSIPSQFLHHRPDELPDSMLDGGPSGKMPPGWVCLDSGNRAPPAFPAPECNHFGLVMELPFAHLVCGDVILSRAWRRLDPDQANIGPRSTDRVSGGWMSTRLHMCPDLVLSTASRIILLWNLSGTAYTARLSYECWISGMALHSPR